MEAKNIRQLTGMNRAEFSRVYGIPYRTVEDWESGKRSPAEWVLKLLERAIREDMEAMK